MIDLLNDDDDDDDDNWFGEILKKIGEETKTEKSRKRIRSNSMNVATKSSTSGKRPYRPFGLCT